MAVLHNKKSVILEKLLSLSTEEEVDNTMNALNEYSYSFSRNNSKALLQYLDILKKVKSIDVESDDDKKAKNILYETLSEIITERILAMYLSGKLEKILKYSSFTNMNEISKSQFYNTEKTNMKYLSVKKTSTK